MKKSSTLNIRIDPVLKGALREAARKENRSVSYLLEVMIRHHCEVIGVDIPEQKNLFDKNPVER